MAISIQSIIGGGLLDSIKGLIEQFHTSPEQKAQIQAAIDANAEQLREKELEWDEKLNDVAGQNIRTETSSNDPWVRRARPMFLWVMTFGIALSVTVFPLINVALHKGLVFPAIPDAYLSLFRDAFLGYTVARTWEKVKGQD